MTDPKFVVSCSGGKDSVATLIVAAENNEPLDEAIFSEVMFDKTTSGEVPEHRDFVYDVLKPFCENEIGIKFNILHAEKTYDDVFHHIIVRGPHQGMKRGFAWPGMCTVPIDCTHSRPSKSSLHALMWTTDNDMVEHIVVGLFGM